LPDAVFFAGIALLLVCIALTLALVLEHFGGIDLPGCRPGGACAQAAAGKWGKVPGTSWPISFVGFAYFVGMMIAWLTCKGGLSMMLKYLVRVGMFFSVMYLMVLIVEGHACYYCIGAHLANIAFWLLVERCRTIAAAPWRPIVTTAVVFALASAALGAVESRKSESVLAVQEKELAESVADIVSPATQAAKEEPQTVSVVEESEPDIERPWKGGFVGRYLRGPKSAPIRIVMLTDYQCIDCYRTETDIENIFSTRDDVSLSVKHFPMSSQCNRHFQSNDLHPNACWSARAAEAAGMLGGNEGFWKMHDWLFEQKGGFTNDVLKDALAEMGFDPQQFINVMSGTTTEALVKSDIEEGIWLGLHYTPMIFINGKELKGIFAPAAVSRAVAALAATNPPPMNHENDQPPPAAEKYIADWQENVYRFVGEDSQSWPMGAVQGAKLQVVVWGDFQEPFSKRVDDLIRAYISGRDDAQYLFRQYPINQACNSSTQLTKHEFACRAAQAAEAAGMIGGLEAYRAMHEWLFANQDELKGLDDQAAFDAKLREASPELGLLSGALIEKMDGPEVAAAIQEDCTTAKSLGLTSIPFVFVNGRQVPRWFKDGDSLLDRVFQVAQTEDAAEVMRRSQQEAAFRGESR
jgi:protein-disulfide isomerase